MTPQEIFAVALAYTRSGLETSGYVTDTPLMCAELTNAMATAREYYSNRTYTGAVYDGRGKLVKPCLRYNDGDIVPVDSAEVDLIAAMNARTVEGRNLYGGIFFPILGHFFFETISRLWPLLWFGTSPKPQVTVYFHHWPGLDIETIFSNPLYVETFRAFGLERGQIRLIEPALRFPTLIVPEAASKYHLYVNRKMAAIFDHIADHIAGRRANQGGERRVYLSRSAWTDNQRVKNEALLDAAMQARGFEVIHTQRLDPVALIGMLQSVSVLVSCDGSHAHLAAFCRPGTRCVLLDTRPVPTQFAITALRNFRAVHVPLYQTPLFRFENGICEWPTLEAVLDLCLTAT